MFSRADNGLHPHPRNIAPQRPQHARPRCVTPVCATCYPGSSFGAPRHYYYIVKRRFPHYVSLKCHDKACSAGLKFFAGNPVPTTLGAHNHAPEDWVLERNQLFQSLRRRAVTEATALQVIYDQEAARYPLGAAHLIRESVKSSMRKWRSANTPAIPHSLGEYAVSLRNTRHAQVYVGQVSAGGAAAVVLGMPGFALCLRRARYLLADGTFDAAPAEPATVRQILTVHTVCEGRFFHPVVALMENRTQELYVAVFRLLQRLAGNPEPEFLLSDYEQALSGAMAEVFPAARIAGCYFHFTQALERRARALGIATGRNTPGNLTVRTYAALALLPAAYVPAALADMEGLIIEVQGQWHPDFHQYFVSFWAHQVGPERFCVGAELHRTTNIAESFHAKLNESVRRRPNVWELTATLEQKLVVSGTRFAAHQRGELPGSRNFARLLVRRNTVLRLQQDLGAGNLTLRQCLVRLGRLVTVHDGNNVAEGEPDVGAEVEIGGGAEIDIGDLLEVVIDAPLLLRPPRSSPHCCQLASPSCR
ncbi:MULE transposase domain-containing protein [Phthorimaea operculella]|nr:MULE transposase domain-containing protein [Phthorimaea operculella]